MGGGKMGFATSVIVGLEPRRFSRRTNTFRQAPMILCGSDSRNPLSKHSSQVRRPEMSFEKPGRGKSGSQIKFVVLFSVAIRTPCKPFVGRVSQWPEGLRR